MAANKYAALEATLQRLRKANGRQVSTGEVPRKSKTKHASRASVSTFAKSLQGVPNGGIVGMIAAPRTGARVRRESIGVLRSATNANTTSGSYNTTVVRDETKAVVSNAQGRVEFGR